jgi:hypothetical protein
MVVQTLSDYLFIPASSNGRCSDSNFKYEVCSHDAITFELEPSNCSKGNNFTAKHFYDGTDVSAAGGTAHLPSTGLHHAHRNIGNLRMLGRARLPMYDVIKIEALSKERA